MARSGPPRWADRFVERICPEEYLEEVQGDLHEAFYWRSEAKSRGYANRKFIYEALRTIQLFRFKSSDIMKNLYLQNLRSYFRTGWRFLWKTRMYSSINIFGLAIGIASATLALLYLSDQFSYDRFHQNADRLYRINPSMMWEGERDYSSGASYIMGKVFPEQVSGIERASHIKIGLALRPVDQDYIYQRFHYASGNLFEMLDFDFINGAPGPFEDPNQIVIAESMAKKLSNTEELVLSFGEEDQIFQIAGVYKDMPKNSSLRPEIIIPINYWVGNVPARRTVNWFDINMNVFVQASEGVSQSELETEMNKVFASNYDVTEYQAQVHLQPFKEMHLDPSLEMGNGLNSTINFQVLRVVLLIGLLCLLISCFNYSNFATGNFLSRTREVAVRRVMGAHKSAIFQQFLSESFLSSLLASLLGLLLIILVLPAFSKFVNEEYSLQEVLSTRFLLGLLAVLLLSTFLSGIYPSLVLASQKVGNALKQKLKVGGRSIFGWSLITLQVGLTLFLIIGMLTVDRQLKHLVNFDLGYEDANVLSLTLRGASDQNVEQLKQKFSQLSFVESVSANSRYNGTDFHHNDKRIETNHLRVDPEFIDLLDIDMVSGRNFDMARPSDQKGIIVNETFIKATNLEDPIGKQVAFDYGEIDQPQIIGVVKDFDFLSPKNEMEPLVMYTSPEYVLQEFLVKFKTASSQQNIQAIESAWRSVFPMQPINYAWLEEINAARMNTEVQIQKLSRAGSLIAILLASLGLFGIVGTHVRQRLKEVSIRKVNGASAWNIYWLFSKKFSTWLGIGFVLGSIPAVFVLNNWLNNYPERIALGIGTPLLGTLICILVFAIVISLLLVRVIRVNPVVHLKDE